MALNGMGGIDRYKELVNERGVPGAASIIVAEHDAGQYDAIDGFLQIESVDASFWTMDSLAHYVVARVEKLDVTKAISLCVKLERLEGNDLAAGRIYEALETYLSSHADDARVAFDIAIDNPDCQPALPCASRVLNRTDAAYVLDRLLESRSLAAIFSLQFCATVDEASRMRVLHTIEESCGPQSDDNLKRASYLTARAWHFEGLLEKLLIGGSAGVLRAAVFELSDSDLKIDESAFKKRLGYFYNVDKDNEFLWDRLDWVLQQNYCRFATACLDFATAHLGQTKFSGFTRFLATEIGSAELLRVLTTLLVSGNQAEEYFAFQIASRIELNKNFEVPEIDNFTGSRSFAFRKCLGWLFGRQEVCLPLCLGIVKGMKLSEWAEIADIFYDPICLHYPDSMERLMSSDMVFADKGVEKQARNRIQDVVRFYRELNEKGSCNELHPNAEMLVAAGRRESELMARAFKTAHENSVFSKLFSHTISPLHGGKMICYGAVEGCEMQRQVVPLHHQSVSVKIPQLLALSGTFLEDRLMSFRMEGRS